MRLRKKKWARPEIENGKFTITEPKENKGKWKEFFGSDKDIYLELGCGRGAFLANHALNNRNINYIAIDIKDEIVVCAKRTVEALFEKNNREVDNVKIIPLEIAFITDIFDKDEISKIYINFCNPWPKDRHNKRRLTHTRFLERYKTFIKPGTEIWFKTDDTDLFNASQEYFKESGFDINYLTYDLHSSDFKGNIVTEYESKFTSLGMKTMFLLAKLM